MDGPRIRVSLPAQVLELHDAKGRLLRRYPVSTAALGAGEANGSFRTPRGKHLIRAKIGAGQPAGAVFRGRRPTGEIWSPEREAAEPDRDWILSRILWLSGREPGRNRLGPVDSMRRYIYIHGTPDSAPLGVPASHGCVRMRNADVIELFDRVPPYTPVSIEDFAVEEGGWAELGAEAGAIREAVFVHEQGVPLEMEWDEFDAPSRHVLARDAAGRPVGTGRLLPDGHIGRMAVRADWRGQGVGAALLDRLLEMADREGRVTQMLHAQTHACGFYARFGFVAEGPEFDEAGIPHRLMVRSA